MRRDYKRWQSLPLAEKQQLRKRFEQFRSLPKAEREQLRQRVRELDPKRRERFSAEELGRGRPTRPTDVRPNLEPAPRPSFERPTLTPAPRPPPLPRTPEPRVPPKSPSHITP